jgi:uncharacterized protein YndB with AHSA1/START domain
MATTRIHVDAPPAVVWDVLMDPAAYRIWVVGSKRIRGVDAGWPQPGSRFHHAVGWGPIEDKDSTEVCELDPPHRLVLDARIWPLGSARVTLTLAPEGAGCTVTMEEEPHGGPAAALSGLPPMEAALWARNRISLRRLKDWSEQRHRAAPGTLAEPA